MEILNQKTERNAEDVDAWWLKAATLESLGRSEAALELYDKVAVLNVSKAIGAWIRKSDIFVSLGRFNDSLKAFDSAFNLLATEDKQNSYTIWWDEDTVICYETWLADGQILRMTSAWYNRSCGDFENIIVASSDLVGAWQSHAPEKTISQEGRRMVLAESHNANVDQIWFSKCCGNACGG